MIGRKPFEGMLLLLALALSRERKAS